MSRHGGLWALVLVLALAGCAGDDGPAEGAAADADAGDAGDAGCPDGWRRMDSGIGCEPPPLREDCPPGSFAVPTGACTQVWECPEGWHRIEDVPPTDADGEPLRPRLDIGCEPVYDACPEGQLALTGGGCDDLGLNDCGADPWGDHDWPADTLYVAADAAAEGADGSREHPYPTAIQAVEAAAPGGTVALGAGNYEAPLSLDRDLRLGGRCAAQVTVGAISVVADASVDHEDLTVDGADNPEALVTSQGTLRAGRLHFVGGTEAVVRLKGGAVELDRVRVGPSAGNGIAVINGELVCDRCLVWRTFVAGAYIVGPGTAELSRTAIHDTQPRAGSGEDGVGITVWVGRLVLADVVLAGNREFGLHIVGGTSEVVGTRVVVRDTQPRAKDQASGVGVGVYGGRLVLTDAVLARNRTDGLDVKAEFQGTRVVVRDTKPTASDGELGRGVHARGRLVLTDVLLAANREVGLYMKRETSEVDGTRVVVRDTRLRVGDQGPGAGVEVRGGALTFTDAVLAANKGLGLSVHGEAAEVEGARVVVRDMGREGVRVARGGRLALTDAVLSSNRYSGLSVVDEASEVEAARVVARDTRGRASARTHGLGVIVHDGARLALADAVLAGNRAAGLFVSGEGTKVEGARVVVRDTQPQANDQRFGRGVNVQGSGHLVLFDAALVANHEVGLLVHGDATEVQGERVVVRDTVPGVSDDDGGWGVDVTSGGRLVFTDVALGGNREFGVVLRGARGTMR